MKTTAAQTTPPTKSSAEGSSASARTNFIILALNMSWQLLVVVLVPVIIGVRLDKAFNANVTWTLVGLFVALVGSIAVIWRSARIASGYPVPKLSPAERKAVQKRIAEEDADD